MFKSNKNKGLNNGITDKLLLRGLIFCKECGHTIGFRAQEQNTKKHGNVVRIYGNCNYWSKRKKQNVCTPHSVKYNDIEEVVLMELKKMCKKYLDAKNLENILKTSNKLEQKKEKIKIEILKLENNNNKLNKKIDACYNDKLEDNITLDMYKRAYNNFIGKIQTNNHKIEKYKEDLINLENNKLLDDDYYTNKIKEFMKLENPTCMFIASLIDKIEIDEDKNINIYYKFKLV